MAAAADEAGEDSHDEEYYIEQAKKLSMEVNEPGGSDAQQPAAQEPE